MPASLLPSLRGVSRHESTRSDSSNTSQSSTAGNKKVSFSKAVRVKKFPAGKGTPADTTNDDEQPAHNSGKRFWFKVYKNKHNQSPDPSETRRRDEVIYYDNDGEADGYHGSVISYHPNPSPLNYPVFTSESGTQTPNRRTDNLSLLGNESTPLHPSQMPSDPPEVRRNHVKKIVNRFNEEAFLQRQRSFEDYPRLSESPPGMPKQYSTPKDIPIPPPLPPPTNYSYMYEDLPPMEGLFAHPRTKKTPVVNGVKVMFGSEEKENKFHPNYHREPDNLHNVYNGTSKSHRDLYRNEYVSEGSDTDVKVPRETFYYGDPSNHNSVVKYNGHRELDRRFEDRENRNGHYYGGRDYFDGKGKYHVDTWDSGNQLLFDTTDVNTSTERTDNGEFMSTIGEKHQLWRNNKRIVVYEEPTSTIIRRKAKSQSDLTKQDPKYPYEEKLDKGISTDEIFAYKNEKKDTLSKKQKDSWLKHFRSNTKEKGIQCNKVPSDEPEELYGFGKYKIMRPRNGAIATFNNVPKSDKTKASTTHSSLNDYNSKDSVIYSQIDKSKKKKEKEKKKFFSEEGKFGSLFKSRSEPLYIGPPPKSRQQADEEIDGSYIEDNGERTVKTSKRSFGFKLHAGKEDPRRSPYYEEDWYNIDGDVASVERQKKKGIGRKDIPENRHEIVEEEISDASSLSNGVHKRNGGVPGSVMREVDYKKREISYENVPRSESESNSHTNAGLWYRDADEDYRREMAQNEVSYPAGNSVGSDRFYTIDRKSKATKKPPPSPRAYTLDRRHLKEKDKSKPAPNPSSVKILVNGKEIKDKSSSKKLKRREDPSSVQSDPLCVRGGLAAAYQARQRAAVRRSNSTASGLSTKYYGGSTPNIRRVVAPSERSGASSGSENSRQHRPLVMYIPGVSHPEKSSENEDRLSSRMARSQSMLAPTRPPRVSKRSNQKAYKGSKLDIYRNGDIYEEDEITPLASDLNRKKPPKVPSDSRKNGDIKRRHSMPKDTKFSWLKWKIRGKPSREP